jgi:hypothetical protein
VVWLQSKERRIRSDAGVVTALESHTAARRRLKELQEEVSGHEELQQVGVRGLELELGVIMTDIF